MDGRHRRMPQTNKPTNKVIGDRPTGLYDRKRSRSEVGEERAEPQRRVLFPNRQRRDSSPVLDIDIPNLPLMLECPDLKEVDQATYEDMLASEVEYLPNPEYFSQQPFLTPRMRAVLLDWMIEVAQEYGLKRDTLHTAVNFVDRYLSRASNANVPRQEVQLVGVTALWLASKIEEILPPPVSDFAAATDGGCSTIQMMEMESKMVESLGWMLIPATPFTFAIYYLQLLFLEARKKFFASMEKTPLSGDQKSWMRTSVLNAEELNRVMELIDVAILDMDSLCFKPSQLAATAIYTLLEKVRAETLRPSEFLQIIGLKHEDVADCAEWFRFTGQLPPGKEYQHRAHVLEHTPQGELHFIQRHNPDANALNKEMSSRRNGRHPAAERALKRRMNVLLDNEEPEIVEIRQGSSLAHRAIRDIAGTFSPTTQVAMQFESTSITVHNAHPSPQRPTRFNE